jgi:hypothetical protein
MTPKNFVMIMIAFVGAIAIIVTAFIANGSEREDAWLYVLSILLVVMAAYEVYSNRKGKAQ